MSDLISRHDAINAFRKAFGLSEEELDDSSVRYDTMHFFEIIDIIEELPTMKKRGKWIQCISTTEGQITWYDYKCSCCSHHRDRRMNFCEVCGADMRGEEK